jgi:membrane fusion protein, multidrug efflux system
MKVCSLQRAHAVLLVVVMALAALLTACGGGKKQEQPGMRTAVVPVTLATAVKKDVPVQLRSIGAVEPYNRVDIKTQVTGQLMNVYFREGQDVRKGDLLFQLDPRPFDADLKRNEGMLARDEAQAANARAEAQRYQAMLKEGIVAQQQADAVRANAEALQAAVAADKAAVDNARVQLHYTRIYAPLEGRTGNLVVQQGNMIKANENPALVSINQVQPIYVSFTLPENSLAQVRRYMGQGKLKVLAMIPNDPKPAEGALTFIDNAVDRQTGTIRLKGTFVNADRRLWPGQFVNVVLTLTTEPNRVVVPAQAVQTGQQGQYVFVIKSDMTAENRAVAVARTIEGEAVIDKGVNPGERVVTDGQVRLVPGSKVEDRTPKSTTAGGAVTQGTQL